MNDPEDTSPPIPTSGLDPPAVEQLRILKEEVDALQVHVMKGQRPWYKTAPVIVATLALLFSFGTTLFSFMQTRQQRRHETRIELRSLIQRLTELPRDHLEITYAYEGDPDATGLLSTLINQEHEILTDQAIELIYQIPEDTTASELLAVSAALETVGRRGESFSLVEEAIERAQTAHSAVEALRRHAELLFEYGEITAGREQFQLAVEVLEWPEYELSDDYKDFQRLITEMGWAKTELYLGDCEEARSHLPGADQFRPRPTAGGGIVDPMIGDWKNLARAIEELCPPPGPLHSPSNRRY